MVAPSLEGYGYVYCTTLQGRLHSMAPVAHQLTYVVRRRHHARNVSLLQV